MVDTFLAVSFPTSTATSPPFLSFVFCNPCVASHCRGIALKLYFCYGYNMYAFVVKYSFQTRQFAFYIPFAFAYIIFNFFATFASFSLLGISSSLQCFRSVFLLLALSHRKNSFILGIIPQGFSNAISIFLHLVLCQGRVIAPQCCIAIIYYFYYYLFPAISSVTRQGYCLSEGYCY